MIFFQAFPFVSTVEFNYPRGAAAMESLESVLNWLEEADKANDVNAVNLVVWDDNDEALYKDLIEKAKRQIVASRTPTPRIRSQLGTEAPSTHMGISEDTPRRAPQIIRGPIPRTPE